MKTILFLLIITTMTFAQKSIAISSGLGISELAHIGVQYKFERIRLALKLGHDISSEVRNNVSVTGEIYFFNSSDRAITQASSWYLMLSFAFYRAKQVVPGYSTSDYFFKELDHIGHAKSYGMRIGKEYLLGNKLGLNIDFGLAYVTTQEKNSYSHKEPFSWLKNYTTNLIPYFPLIISYGINIFYEL